MEQRAFLGTDLKFLVEPDGGEDFNKERDEFEVTISRGSGKERTWSKSELITDSQGNYYVTVDTDFFGAGTYMITVVTHTPDEDFDSGFRDDVEQMELILINKTKK